MLSVQDSSVRILRQTYASHVFLSPRPPPAIRPRVTLSSLPRYQAPPYDARRCGRTLRVRAGFSLSLRAHGSHEEIGRSRVVQNSLGRPSLGAMRCVCMQNKCGVTSNLARDAVEHGDMRGNESIWSQCKLGIDYSCNTWAVCRL